MNRPDISIQIDRDGTVYVAQGKPAQAKLSTDYAAYADGLYFSQTAHRVAVRRANGRLEIATPREVDVDDLCYIHCDIRGIKCTENPRVIGKI